MKSKMLPQMLIGLIIGIISPVFVAFIIYKLRYNYITPDMFNISKALLVPLLQWGALSNLAWFFVFNQFRKEYIQRGIIFATIIIAFYVVYLKFFG